MICPRACLKDGSEQEGDRNIEECCKICGYNGISIIASDFIFS